MRLKRCSKCGGNLARRNTVRQGYFTVVPCEEIVHILAQEVLELAVEYQEDANPEVRLLLYEAIMRLRLRLSEQV